MEQDTSVPGEVVATQVTVDQIELSPAQKLRKTPAAGTDAYREYNRQQQQESRQRKAQKKSVEGLKYTSKLEVTKSEALELLANRVHNEHVREVAYRLALKCAAATGVPVNRFLFAHGYQKLIAIQQAKSEQFLEMDHSVIISSECIHQGDLFAIFDYSVSWREPDVTFSDFIEMRRIVKSDWFELGQFLNVPLEEKPHRSWQQFLPACEPGLRPGYTLGEMREWLSKQKSPSYPVTTRDFLLQAPRGAMKSSAGHIFLAQALLCAPSLRLLVCSETTKFSNKFVKQFRAQFESGSDPIYERFQYFFPEFCIEPGDGSVKVFTSPMRSIAVQDETLEAVSMEMAAQGRRFDIGWFDDCIGKTNTANNDQREKSLETYGALLKLREAGSAGIVVCIGTPWVQPPPGESGDMYWELMQRNNLDPTHPMAVLRQSAWILKPESAHLFPDHLNALTEDHVQEFLFPSGSRLSFRDLMKEARFNISDFYTQFLCQYIETEESKWAVTFTLDELLARVKPLSFFSGSPVSMTVAAIDTAFSRDNRADRSAIVIARVLAHQGRNVAYIVEVIADRWKYSDLAVQIVQAFAKHNVNRAVIERSGPWEELQANIQRAAGLRGIVLPHLVFKQSTATGTSVPRKVFRVKGAEMLMRNDQLYFAPGLFNEKLFDEMVRFTGKKSSSRKDDMVDGVGMLVESFLVRDTGGGVKPTREQEEMERQVYAQELLRQQHQMYFGTGRNTFPHSLPTAPQPAPPRSPIDPVVNKLGLGGLFRRAS
jgi:phosphoserine phosphatase